MVVDGNLDLDMVVHHSLSKKSVHQAVMNHLINTLGVDEAYVRNAINDRVDHLFKQIMSNTDAFERTLINGMIAYAHKYRNNYGVLKMYGEFEFQQYINGLINNAIKEQFLNKLVIDVKVKE